MSLRKPASLAVALGFAASLACMPALAQQEGMQQPEQLPEQQRSLEEIDFQQIDQDGDGQVSKEEFLQQGSEEAFQQADQNGDGVVTEQELQNAKQEQEQQKQQQQE